MTRNIVDQMIQVNEESQGYMETYEEDALINIKNDITKFKDRLKMY